MITYRQLIEGLEQIGNRLGSNKGGKYYDFTTRQNYYIKFPKNPDQAKSEALAAKIQSMMGIHTLEPEHKIINGEHAVVSKWVDGLEKLHHSHLDNLTPEHDKELGKIYAAAILTKNWDSTGTGLDYDTGNIDIHPSGHLYNIDPGGSFEFRAQGGHKDYTPDINEKDSLRNDNLNWESANVYNTAFKRTPESIEHGLNAVRNLNPHKVKEAFSSSGLSNWEQLHNTFLKRKELLLKNT